MHKRINNIYTHIYIGITLSFVISRKILLVCRVYSHLRRGTPLHGKQQSTTTSVRKFAAPSILSHVYKCRRMRASRRGYLLVALNSRKK